MKTDNRFFLQFIALVGFFLLFGFGSARADFADKEFLKEEQDSIRWVAAEWATNLSARDPVKIVALYNDPSILYATFETKVDTREGLLRYFTELMKKENLKVKFDEQNIRVKGPVALNSGLYTFSYKEEGKTKKVPARFTFVYTLTSDGWKIVDHHSSVFPE